MPAKSAAFWKAIFKESAEGSSSFSSKEAIDRRAVRTSNDSQGVDLITSTHGNFQRKLNSESVEVSSDSRLILPFNRINNASNFFSSSIRSCLENNISQVSELKSKRKCYRIF